MGSHPRHGHFAFFRGQSGLGYFREEKMSRECGNPLFWTLSRAMKQGGVLVVVVRVRARVWKRGNNITCEINRRNYM